MRIKIKKILLDNRWLLIPYVLAFAGCIFVLCFTHKGDTNLAVNALHTHFLDGFFKFMTGFGTFAYIGPCLLVMCLFSWRIALTGAVSAGFSSLFTQFCKHVVWPDSPRPKIHFAEILQDLHLIDGVHLHASHSFPSGHTTGAFALFCVMALFCKRPGWKVFFLLMAVTVAYSRLYLMQHFLIDVTVGSFIGMLAAVLSFWWLIQYRQSWLDKSALQLFHRK